jgi:hypothetical protein
MPLLDHFHPPLYPARSWESIQALWAGEIVATLNERVPPQGYYAETQVHIGSRVEVDVATLERPQGPGTAPPPRSHWRPGHRPSRP